SFKCQSCEDLITQKPNVCERDGPQREREPLRDITGLVSKDIMERGGVSLKKPAVGSKKEEEAALRRLRDK
ncbi:MAG: hypothetical protein ACMG6E_06820, partial [Candidatus Roizmanbacteria bacterium]